MRLKYFLPVCDWPINFLEDVFDEKCLVFMKFCLSLCVCSQSMTSVSVSSCVPVFAWSFYLFVVFAFTFRFMLQLEMISGGPSTTH